MLRRCSSVVYLLTGLFLGVHVMHGQTDTITNAAGVQALSAPEAAQARPVVMRAVVMAESEPRERALVVADESGGVYVLATTNIFAPYHRGDLLELIGVTDPGEFAPIIKASAAEKLGTAPLPSPRPVTYHQLLTGALDAQWVELAGVVQQYLPPMYDTDVPRVVLSCDGGLVHVRLSGPRDPNLQEDAEVRVPALCFHQFNQKRQMLSPVLQVLPGIPVTIVKAAPPDPFAAPVRAAASLLSFSPGNSLGHRVHVRGVVTHSQPGSFVWIRDASSGLRIQTRSREPLQPGNLIDLLGFPKFGAATPSLEDAIFRTMGTTNSPAPIWLTDPANAFDHENDLVSLEATLYEIAPAPEGLSLSLECTGLLFKASFMFPPNTRAPSDWLPGSRVRVAGICSVNYDDPRPLMGIWHPESFQVLLRSPADLTILQGPPWWTPRRVAFLLAFTTASLLLVAGVVTLFARRRLREQQQQRALAEAEFAAILSERNRVAREIHDTLAQGLATISVRLSLAKKHATGADAILNRQLDAAQELVRGSLEEARCSIWNTRSQVLETGDLPTALNNILRQMAEGSELKTEFKVTGRRRRLAPVIENNLLRAGQEAITNATRHAHARRICVALDFGEKQFRLSVKDDGRGFDVTSPPKSDGGFGLVGMRERVKELKGELDIRSAPTNGTEVNLNVPLAGD